AELAAAEAERLADPAGEDAHLDPHLLGELQAEPVADVEDLPLLPVRAVGQPAVGEDAVDVEEDPLQGAGAPGERFVGGDDRIGQNSSSRQRSCRWTTPSSRPAASQTKREVMRWSSMVFKAAAASAPPEMVRGFRVITSPAVWRIRFSS